MSSALPIPRQLTNSDTLTDTTDLTAVLQQSFMQPCSLGALYIDDPISKTLAICDHAVLMDNKLLLISEKTINVTHEQGLTKKKIRKARQDAIYEAHHQLTEAVNHVHDDTVIYTDKSGTHVLDLPTNVTTYLICATAIHVRSDNKTLRVTHHYGSDYFLEDCVLDYDDEAHTIQIFSLGDLTTIIDNLPNMPDFGSFLACHKTYVVSGGAFDNELQVLGDFIETGEVLVNARQIETDLLAAGMRNGMDPKLVVADASEHTDQFVTMRKNASFWDQLIEMFARQIPEENWQDEHNSYRALLLALMNESVYSRNNLVRAIADFTKANEDQKREGYIMHMRSYAQAARHYVLLFYGNDPSHPNHRDTARSRLQNVASGVNFHAQEPHLDEIIVIGIEDHQHQPDKDSKKGFGVDMYYMLGSAIDEQTRAEIVAAQQAQLQAQKQMKGHSPVDFADAGNMPHHADSNSPATAHGQKDSRNSQNVRPIDEKNAAATKYDTMRNAPKNRRARPQPLSQRSGIKRLKVTKAQPKIATSQIGSRNALCPCGSGKKFRHCHGAEISYSA